MKTTRQVVSTMAGGLAACLALTTPLHAQTGAMKGQTRPVNRAINRASPKDGSSDGRAGTLGMMGLIKVTGIATMNGKTYAMQGAMTPVDSRVVSAGSKPLMSSRAVRVGRPLEMAGTMTMMGQAYYCTVTLTPQANILMQGK